ncbi:hypothetical protein R1sor_015210 [Riccia sorocarpa]|uniref:Uncharacterized protein n=1 Tax=Riccia sorocarpa TaxID=122646 RepID=A0ABD3HFW0_9MARC
MNRVLFAARTLTAAAAATVQQIDDMLLKWRKERVQFRSITMGMDIRRNLQYGLIVFILGSLCPSSSCGRELLQQIEKKTTKIWSLAYGYNPPHNKSFATDNVLLPDQHLRGWDGWGVYLSSDCVIKLAQKKGYGIKKTVWVYGPGLENASATDCFAEIAPDGDFSMYYSDGAFAASIIQHPWALESVSSTVGYELSFTRDSIEWHHHMILQLRHYNWKVDHVTLWQDLLSISD